MQFKKKTVDWKKYTTVLKGGEFKIENKATFKQMKAKEFHWWSIYQFFAAEH